MSGGVQLRLVAELPLDPVELAKVPLLQRVRLYEHLQLAPEQREVAEQAVRLVVAKRYRRPRGLGR